MRFRKKPVEIEARELTPRTLEEIGRWIGVAAILDLTPKGYIEAPLGIRTLEGILNGQFGDWIIRGVQGEFYPCKPDIFEQTYECVKDSEEISK